MVAFVLALACIPVDVAPTGSEEAWVDETLDSDGDGYLDIWEIAEGTDPYDYDSRIYTGFWPYQPDKDEREAPELALAQAELDAQLARFVAMDQHGDFVDVYDFAGQGRPVVLDLNAMWCGPCHELSMWLLGEEASDFDGGWETDIPEAVRSGEVLWVTVMTEADQGALPDSADLVEWYAAYPNPEIPILGDDGRLGELYVRFGWPSLYLLDEDLRIQAMPTSDEHYAAMDALELELGSSR
jgi:thiol-disulfide isomerase/thioredoxin